jgi:hypothetical protein
MPRAGGNGTIYVGTYAKKILVVNEANLKVVDSIPVSVGIPTSMVLSTNRKHFYVLDPQFENVEVIDIATRKAIDKFTLSSGNTRVRLWGINVDPRERFAVVLVKTYTKLRDRFEVGKPTLLRYDLAKKTVTDTIPWPKGEERDGAQIIFSPTGSSCTSSPPTTCWCTAPIRSSRSIGGSSRARCSRKDRAPQLLFPDRHLRGPRLLYGTLPHHRPGESADAHGRRARGPREAHCRTFYTLGPSEPVNFRLAPGRRRAYGLRQQVGNYEFWTFDLEGRRVAQRSQFAGPAAHGTDAELERATALHPYRRVQRSTSTTRKPSVGSARLTSGLT